MATNDKISRDFKLTTLSLKNKNTVFLLLFVIILFGGISYTSLPKELFPEVSFPTILVQTTYPGNTPEDIENLVTRPLEKELKTVKGLNDLSSISAQGASMIFVEFTTDTEVKDAKLITQDAVDQAITELPNDPFMFGPTVFDIDFSEFPVININLSGDYSLSELKEFAEYLQDEMETIYEVSKVEIKGVNEKEIQINVDPYKLDAFSMSFTDIERAISSENISMSGGEIKMGDVRRPIRIVGEFQTVQEMKEIIVKHEDGNIVYLKDVAEVVEGYEDVTSIARLDRQPVVSVQVVKKSGENLLKAIDQVFEVLDESKEDGMIPQDLNITITNDQSKHVKNQLENLENSMIISIIFVIGVLFFFLGLRNALFVGLAIPMSLFLSMVVLGAMGATINMMVLFSLILALGMLVDNAIVVVENIYRYVDNGYAVMRAARKATGEIAMPIISSTATTLAAFFPLIFWDDIMGEFMKFLPITLIIVLTSSLFVALIIVPVLSSTFIKTNGTSDKGNHNLEYKIIAALAILSIPFYAGKILWAGNLIALFAILGLMQVLFLERMANWFQAVFLVKLENFYLKFIKFSLFRPWSFLLGTLILLFFTLVFMAVRKPKVVLFPENEPQYVNVIAELASGTDIVATDRTFREIEDHIFQILEPYDDITESVLVTIGEGVKRFSEWTTGRSLNKAMVTIKFVDYELRKGINTSDIMKLLTKELNNKYPGIEIFVEKDEMGPPAGNPINIEVTGRKMPQLIQITDSMQVLIENAGIEGIEKLKIDVEIGKPELRINVDREKVRRFGMSTYQVANTIRTALFGSEISDFKVGEDEYPIQLRLAEEYRNNLPALMNQTIVFRNNMGKLLKIPVSAVASFEFTTSYGSIMRHDQKRALTLFSSVVEGFNANEINNQIKKVLEDYQLPDGYEYSFTGEQQEQQKSMNFLISALLIAVSIILIILVTQFNSIAKPFIIMASVFFSTIGVFGGIATFNMDFVIIMTGIGIISLAGVVVNNAIVLIDYIDLVKSNRKKELGMEEDENLPIQEIMNCIVTGGKTRLRPVLLTAITTILGLLPMAIGVNIDFEGLFNSFEPNVYLGGDNTLFWGPMSWTVIFGLTFATFLTLIIVPVMYLIANKVKIQIDHLLKK